MPPSVSHHPPDATLSVTKAARLLGVHPNTVRAWSDQGRLRYYRINPRGDRRYRLGDLQRFLAAAEPSALDSDGLPNLGSAARHTRSTERRQRQLPPVTRLGLARLGPPRPSGPALASGAVARSSPESVTSMAVLGALAQIAAAEQALEHGLPLIARTLRDGLGLRAVLVLERRDGRVVPRAWAGAEQPAETAASTGLVGRALAENCCVAGRLEADDPWRRHAPGATHALVQPVTGAESTWGAVCLLGSESDTVLDERGELSRAVAALLASMIATAHLRADLQRQLRRADALVRLTSDVRRHLDSDRILPGLVDHAMELFDADRAAVFLRERDGQLRAEVMRGLSDDYVASVREFPNPSLPRLAVTARRPLFSVGYVNDPRGQGVRDAVAREGYDTICVAPLFEGPDLLGLLSVYHDRPYSWRPDELDTFAAFADEAAVAIRNAQRYSQMATWAAQLQSIQALGVRLARLTSVHEIGVAIATELRQLIDYHNVRVYRQYDDELVPVAMQGQVGEYVDETPEQLRVRVGEGITGWVAARGVAQNLPDAAADPRAATIPGTEDDLDESMLLAPMLYEDQSLGVLVLSKLGLHQFSEDDLRLLVIYASFAAQAMANAEATERLRAQSEALERQLRSQRELLQITESILSTLDMRAILDQITERLGTLVDCDNIAIEVAGPDGLLRPVTARGTDAARYLEPWEPGDAGIAIWVLEHNEPQLIADERRDERVNQVRGAIPDGSRIVVPLRGRAGAVGVLTLERLGTVDRFSAEEFELVKLFAAQVSIALQNAEIHSAVEVRAQTDDLTRLLNHGTFQERLARMIAAGEQFSLVMIDLDGFKAVNDALGHQAGDRVLREIASVIVRAGRDSDSVFRYGGDEFAMLLPGTDAVGAFSVAERVRAAIGGRAGSDGWRSGDVAVSAAMGLATYPADGATPAEVLLAADRACFVAKRSGRGRIATALEGLDLAGEFTLSQPTPVDSPTVSV